MKNNLCVLAALFAAQTLFAQSAGNMVYNPGGFQNNTGNKYGGGVQMISYAAAPGVNLSVNNSYSKDQAIKADVMMNVKPSSYTAIFSLTQNAYDMTAVDSIADIRISKMIAQLKANPAIKFEYHIDFIALVPRYKTVTEEKRFSKTVNEVPDGFEMKKNIHVLFYNHDDLSDIIAAAGKAEIYECVKVEYNVKNMDDIYDQLRLKAKEVIDEKRIKREAIGFSLELTSMGENQGAVYPIERYAQYTAFKNGTPEHVILEAKKRQDKNQPQTVSYNPQEKSPTIYYERVPYNQFDVVMNADVAEPSVQVFYTLQVNYKVLNKEEELIKKEDRALTVELKKAEIHQMMNPAPVKTK